jgi:hypothetical protein
LNDIFSREGGSDSKEGSRENSANPSRDHSPDKEEKLDPHELVVTSGVVLQDISPKSLKALLKQTMRDVGCFCVLLWFMVAIGSKCRYNGSISARLHL